MKLEELYKAINANTVTDELFILVADNNDFIPKQYVSAIAEQHNLTKSYYDSLEDINLNTTSFSCFKPQELRICKLDIFTSDNSYLQNIKNLIIVCHKIDKKTEQLYSKFVVKIPKLEDWQIKDYLYSELSGVKQEYLDWLFMMCGGNIDRLLIEIERIKLFPEAEHNIIIKRFFNDSIYSDLSDNVVFDFVNSILSRNIDKIKILYNELQKSDINPMGIWTLIYNNFKDLISVQCNQAASAENCNLKPGRFWAIKNNINHYSRESLYNIFLHLTDIDRKIKSGELDTNLLLDYVLLDILNN